MFVFLCFFLAWVFVCECVCVRACLHALIFFFFLIQNNIWEYKTEERQNKTKQDIVRVRVVQSWVKMRPSEQATSIESPEKVGWWWTLLHGGT